MNKSLLEKLKVSSSFFIDIISFLIRADIEIVDVSLNCMSRKIINDNEEGSIGLSIIHRKCIESGQYQLIENPRKNQICNNCTEKFRCLKKLEMGFPIVFEGKVIGAVGISCYDIKEREKILRGHEVYVNLITKILELMCFGLQGQKALAGNETTFESLKSVGDSLQQGLTVIGKDGKIKYINKVFRSLVFDGQDLEGFNAEIKSDSHNRINIVVNNRNYKISGDIIRSNINKEDTILIYNHEHDAFYSENNSDVYSYSVGNLNGPSQRVNEIKQQIVNISLTSRPVLIIGEKGSGREFAARCIHNESNRKYAPFISVNCDSISMNRLDRQLFGTVENGINIQGDLEKAGGGTLLLNDAQYLSDYMREKIVNVLQLKAFSKDNQDYSVNCRIIYSASKPLNKTVDKLTQIEGIMTLEIPSLRECREDLYQVFNFSFKKHCRKFDIVFEEVTEEMVPEISQYSWPGNLSEMDILAQDTAYAVLHNKSDVRTFIKAYIENNKLPAESDTDELPTLRDMELKLILKAVEKYGNTTEGKKQAANALNIGIATLYRKLAEINI